MMKKLLAAMLVAGLSFAASPPAYAEGDRPTDAWVDGEVADDVYAFYVPELDAFCAFAEDVNSSADAVFVCDDAVLGDYGFGASATSGS